MTSERAERIAYVQRLQEALAECRDHFSHCLQCDDGNDPDPDDCMVCMINATLAAVDDPGVITNRSVLLMTGWQEEGSSEFTDAEWCYMCDRPKNDCGCVENGGNY